ncbi:MAG: hypothetical protein NZ518_00305, partial [Dehalococcoidia bacterium]|nr:hypothetical protein [Dehalococcoidia bacterium]
YQKEGDRLRAATAGMTRDDWAGWRIEPVRLRLMGYVSHGPWSEVPVVVPRAALGLPPID